MWEKFTINNFSYLVPKSWITVENDYGGYYHYGASKGSVDGGFIYSSCTKIDSDQSNVGKVIQNLQDIINGMFGGGEDIPITLLPQDNYLAATYYGELNDYYSNIWVTLDGEFAYILVYIDTSVDHQGQDTAFGFILDTVLIDSKQEINNTERTNSDPILTPSFTPIPTYTVTSNPKQKVHDNRGEVHAIPVGKETGKLSYEIIDYGVEWWNNSIGSKNTFAFIAIKNTDTRYIYLDSCNFEYEDNDGHFLDSESMVSSQPDVIAPGEVGYYYVGGFAGGSLGDGVKTSNGVNLVAQFSLKPSTKNIDMYEVFDDSLSYENTFGEKNPVVKGRIKNNTNEDDSLVYVVAVLKDIYGNVLWISGTNISDVFAGATVGFSNSIWSMSPYVKNGDIASYDIIAKPTHYQW